MHVIPHLIGHEKRRLLKSPIPLYDPFPCINLSAERDPKMITLITVTNNLFFTLPIFLFFT